MTGLNSQHFKAHINHSLAHTFRVSVIIKVLHINPEKDGSPTQQGVKLESIFIFGAKTCTVLNTRK